MKTLQLPEGYELDLENSTKENIVLKEIEKELPKTFEELELPNTTYVLVNSYWPTLELARASKALSKLLFLRDEYNGEWKKGDETEDSKVYIIYNFRNKINEDIQYSDSPYNRPLTFKSERLSAGFIHNFKDLITIALPLL